MLDVVRAVALLLALVRAVRARFGLGVVCALAIAYGLGVAVLDGAERVARHAIPGDYALGLVFMGTAAIPAGAQDRWPAEAWMAAHRSAVLALSAALSLLPFAVASRTSSRLSPHSNASRLWEGVSGPFLLLACIDVTLVLLGVLMAWLVGGKA